ncbi:keratin, type I cytoskeletal 19-like [Mantella aurantiaca]
MSYNTVQYSHGFYSAGREYLGYPMYRSHTSTTDVKINQYSSHSVPHYRIHQVHGRSGGSGIWNSSSGHANIMGYVRRFHKDLTMRRPANHTGWTNSKLFNIDEKKTMQSLNGRLASYLGNVKQLEEENVMLEKKICEWYEKNSGKVYPDFSPYLHMISDLQDQVLLSTEHNASLLKQINDGHIVCDDIKKKKVVDIQMRTVIEKDLHDHTAILETINMEKQNLNIQIQNLEEELQQLKKNSEEEKMSLQAQLGTRVNVEVEMAPSVDLDGALSTIRKEYEGLMERNLSDIEARFFEMTSEIRDKMSMDIDQLQLISNETIDLKLQRKTLEAELNQQMCMASVYNSTLMETNEDYNSQLKHLQDMIEIIEHQLQEIKSKLKQSNDEYKINESIKISLEQEISTYKKLLEGQTNKYV